MCHLVHAKTATSNLQMCGSTQAHQCVLQSLRMATGEFKSLMEAPTGCCVSRNTCDQMSLSQGLATFLISYVFFYNMGTFWLDFFK
jgi:hypothetical protein